LKTFFDNSKEKNRVTHGKAAFELPIFYHRDDTIALKDLTKWLEAHI